MIRISRSIAITDFIVTRSVYNFSAIYELYFVSQTNKHTVRYTKTKHRYTRKNYDRRLRYKLKKYWRLKREKKKEIKYTINSGII